MPEVRYYKDNKPVHVEWVLNNETNEVHLVLDGKEEPVTIELKSSLTGSIIARRKNTVVGSGKPFELGHLKRRVLEQMYNIKFKYVEV